MPRILDAVDYHLSARAKRKLLKRRGDEFIAPSADVQQICEEAGHPEYYIPLQSRIYRAMETDHNLMECVIVDLFQPGVIHLPEKGIAAFRDILTSYFTEKDIDALRGYLHDQTELKQYEYSMRQTIRSIRSPDLKKCVAEWEKMADRKEMDRKATDRLRDMAQRELKVRKRIF